MRDGIHTEQQNTKGHSLGHLIKGALVATLIYQCSEPAALDFQELTRFAEFDDASGVKDHLRKSVNIRKANEQC